MQNRKIIIGMLLIFSYCLNSLSAEEPLAAIDRYFELLRNRDYPKAYAMLAEANRQKMNLADYKEINALWDEYFDLAQSVSPALHKLLKENYLEYKLLESQDVMEKTVLKLEVFLPDLMLIADQLAEAMPELNSADLPDPALDEKISETLSQLFTENLPGVSEVREYTLLKKQTSWLISPNLDKELNAIRIDEFLAAAEKLVNQGKLEQATDLYKEALNLDPDDEFALAGLSRLHKKLGEWEELLAAQIDDFIPENLAISEIVLRRVPDVDWRLILHFTIANKSDVNFYQLGVRIVLFNDKGEIIQVNRLVPLDDNYRSSLYSGSIKSYKMELPFESYQAAFSKKKYTLEIIDYGILD